jgi:hypothetical protein
MVNLAIDILRMGTTEFNNHTTFLLTLLYPSPSLELCVSCVTTEFGHVQLETTCD